MRKNSLIEQEIIKKFVIPNKQERIIYELGNPKKRNNVFWKFAGPDIFKSDCMKAVEHMDADELEKYLFQLGGTKRVYYIGSGNVGEMILQDACKRVCEGAICVIYCGNGIGYYQGEQECGVSPRFLLLENSIVS